MKVRDSGMPEEATWEGFFEPDSVLRRLGLDREGGDVVEFGCGYGTFTIPAARIVSGTVWAIDVEPEMVRRTRRRAAEAGLANVRVIRRDFVERGCGRPGASAGYAMLFNILHAERPRELLAEAWRVLRPGGLLGIVHWVHDASTPRGPDLAFRPRPEECVRLAAAAGFVLAPDPVVALPPYHYGLAGKRG